MLTEPCSWPMRSAMLSFAWVLWPIYPVVAQSQGNAESLRIEVLSTKPHLISGEEVLVRVDAPPRVLLKQIRLRLNGKDITTGFRADLKTHTLAALVTRLKLGENTLEAVVPGRENRRLSAQAVLTRYPKTGPIFSGPHMRPYICMTDRFPLPDGSHLGPALDDNCSAATKVQYVYKSTSGAFKPMTDLRRLPQDAVALTTIAGTSVPYVVRFEAGTIDRGIYNIAILHNPVADAAPSPFTPPKGWNRRLLWVHGFGCTGGWYYQGTNTGTADGLEFGAGGADPVIKPRSGNLGKQFNVLNDAWLAKGYAVATNTLNHPSINCNAVLGAEAAVMTKEHFIETFGVPLFTLSTGASGGAYGSLQLADALPGLFDGVAISLTFPDALSIGLSGLDGHLLAHYFASATATPFDKNQQVAVSGYKNHRAFIDAANQSGRTDAVSRTDIPGYVSGRWTAIGAWPVAQPVPAALRYDPVTRRDGARPTIFDVASAVYGKDPRTGFALQPFDNVGVQYGLSALNGGRIGIAQFLDLNERIGGVDSDGHYIPARTVGAPGAIKRAYQSGLTLNGGGGLASIPVFDFGPQNDDAQYHYAWFHFAVRERMAKANGSTENHVMWRGGGAPFDVMEQWMTAVASDDSTASQREKVIRHKPAAAVDKCFPDSKSTDFIVESQTFSASPDSPCNTKLPSFGFPRLVAGGPLAADILKCQLKPADPKDYSVRFTAAEWDRLRTLFPTGVCDWSRPGLEQVPLVPWASFGPSRRNLVFDVTRP